MNNFSKDLIKSLGESADHAEGRASRARDQVVDVPDLRAIRGKLNFMQSGEHGGASLMAKIISTKSNKRPIEQYARPNKKRANNPPVGLVTPDTDQKKTKRTYAYGPHLDPSLHWAGKAERTSFEIPTVSLHVHERIDPRSILEAVRMKNGNNYEQLALFSSNTETPDFT